MNMMILALVAPFLLVAICLFAAFFISKRQRKQEIETHGSLEELRNTNEWSKETEPEIDCNLVIRQLKSIDLKPYTPNSVGPRKESAFRYNGPQKLVPEDKSQTERVVTELYNDPPSRKVIHDFSEKLAVVESTFQDRGGSFGGAGASGGWTEPEKPQTTISVVEAYTYQYDSSSSTYDGGSSSSSSDSSSSSSTD